MKDTGTLDVSVEAWFAELERLAPTSHVAGHSTEELCRMWGCGLNTARKRIKQLHAAGRIEVDRRYETDVVRRLVPKPVYRLKAADARPRGAKGGPRR